jgi:2-methylcitrate dehydratase PrpD
MDASAHPSEAMAETLAAYVVGLKYEDLPEQVIESTKALVLDQLACQLIGSTLPWVIPALQLVQMTEGVKPESTVINYGSRFLVADVAFVNATFGQACELDDSAAGSAGHFGVATIPVALALGEKKHINGREFLLSIVAGHEIMYRLLKSVTPHNIARGFHSQSIAGPFAGAATAGKILKLDASQMTNAFGIAGSHACGPTEYDQSGGEVKRIHAGLGARGGIHSAQLAQFGLTGPRTIIEGKRGFCNIFATQSDPSVITQGLGQTFGVVNTAYKTYPAVGGIHTAIGGVEFLVAQHDIKADQIENIDIGLAQGALLHGAGIGKPYDVVSAQFSLAFSLALAVVKRNNDLSHYMDPATWHDVEINNVIDRVTAHANPAAVGEKHQLASVAIRLKDGRLFETIVPFRKGSPKNPVTKTERYAKVRSLSGTVLSADRTDVLIDMVERIEELDDVAALINLLVKKDAVNK